MCPARLECFDISHTMGEATVASCVVFDTKDRSNRTIAVSTSKASLRGDDYAAMEQALRRRYTRLMQGEGKLPDVLVIDGGKGQLERRVDVLEELQVDDVTCWELPKGRRAGRIWNAIFCRRRE